MRMDLCSLKSVAISAGEIDTGLFVRGSGRCPQPADGPKTLLPLGECVEIPSESWWEAAYGVSPGTAGVARVSVGRVARYSSQQRRKSLERVLHPKTRSMERENENPCSV